MALESRGHAPEDRRLRPMGRLRGDGSWDLPWPRAFPVSLGVPARSARVPVDADGFLIEPPAPNGMLPRPGTRWLLPVEWARQADSPRLRSVAPLHWHVYGARRWAVRTTGLRHRHANGCGHWLLDGATPDVAADYGMALSQPAHRHLQPDDSGLDARLAALGLGRQSAEDSGETADRVRPMRRVVALAAMDADVQVALVATEETSTAMGTWETSDWALVELRQEDARIVATISGMQRQCAENDGRAESGQSAAVQPSAAQSRSAAECPAAEQGAPATPPSHADALWVARTYHGGSRLDPIARRQADGAWDHPWTDVLYRADLHDLGFLSGAPGYSLDRQGQTGKATWPFGATRDCRIRLQAPLQWHRYTGNAVAPGAVTHAMLAERHCAAAWSLGMAPGWTAVERGWRRPDGVALSRPAAAVLSEADVPGLNAIRLRLNLDDRPPDERGGYEMGFGKAARRYPSRELLGLFRFEPGFVIGIVGEYGYEGAATTVFELTGDSARIVATSYAGGC